MTSDVLRRVTFGLGVLSALSTLVAVLALTDIYRGEADVASEWRAVQAAFAVIIAFHALALASLVGRRQ